MTISRQFAFRCDGDEEGTDRDACATMTEPILADTAGDAWGVAKGWGWSRTYPGPLHFCPTCWAEIRQRPRRRRQPDPKAE